LYDQHRNKVWEDIKSGTENFDRNLLAFSSGALGLSLAFLKDVGPLAKPIWLPSLFVSWIAFALCILITMASFQISIRAQHQTLTYLKEYYLEGKPESFDKHLQSGWSKAVDWCTFGASLFFAAGVITTILFVGANIREARKVSEEKTTEFSITADSMKPAAMTPLERALKPAAMTPVTAPVTEGLKPMGMTPVSTEQSGTQSSPATGTGTPAQPAEPPAKE
jgi:hypothetical protein